MAEVPEGLDEIVEAPPADTPEVSPETPPTTPEPAAAAAPAAPAAEAPAPAAQPQKDVPLAVLIEQRKEAREEVRREREAREQLQRELAELKAQMPKPATPVEPNKDEDPIGYQEFQTAKALAALAETNKRVESVEKTAQAAAQASYEQQLLASTKGIEAQFVAQNPDYYDRLDHVRKVRVAQLRVLAPEATDQQVYEQIEREERGLVAQMVQAGKNPVETIYNLAEQFGYQPKAAPVPTPPAAGGTPRLAPDVTLGTGSGSPAGDDEVAREEDPVDRALREQWGHIYKRRA